MAIQNASDSQKVDYLWKKIAYGAAKTDISGNIDATQEPYASPLLIRADTMWQQSGSIPAVIPSSNSSVVTVYPTTLPIQCTSDAAIPTPNLTWITGVTNWIPPEFGSTYQVKVYIAPTGQAANVTTKGTQVFATGSGNNDNWFFDYKAGILNFNSNNTPYASGSAISFTGNAVYISGGIYAGAFGLTSANSALGNITFTGDTISTSDPTGNVFLTATGNGAVQVTGTSAVGLPSGTTAQRPANPSVGYAGWNTDTQTIEIYSGNTWTVPGSATISSDVFTPNGSANSFSLSSTATTNGVLVSINGTIQQPVTAYTVANTTITFNETPLTTDIIEVRHIVVGATTTITSYIQSGTTQVAAVGPNVAVTGNLIVSGNVVLGNIYVPTLANANGSAGQIVWDNSYVYICVSANNWKRANLAAW